jgi:hydrogenase maturation protease
MTRQRVLVLCYGNPGRLDDGLGPALGAALEEHVLPGVTVDIDYQLTVEDAALAAEHDVVIFADAAVRGPAPFFFRPVPAAAQATVAFSSHGAEPAQVLALARELTGREPAGYALGIRGEAFDDFGESLSPSATDNLAAALRFVLPLLVGKNFEAAVAALGATPSSGAHLVTEN